jgi:homoserine kinase
MTRGLGSSAACVVGGLVAANELSGKRLGKQQLARIAAQIEGHPDNSTPAIVGGIVVGAMDGKNLDYIKIDTAEIVKKGLSFSVMIPDFRLSTEKARGVFPPNYTMKDAVFNASRSALMVASLLTGNLDKLMVSMDDRLHQPYRQSIIPGMAEIFKEAKKLGAKGVFLSGAGPTLIAVNDRPFFNVEMKDFLAALPNQWRLTELEPDNNGVVVEKR